MMKFHQKHLKRISLLFRVFILPTSYFLASTFSKFSTATKNRACGKD